MTKNQNQLDKIGKQVVEDLDMHEDFNNQEIEYIWERFPIQLEEATCHIKSTIQIFLERGEQQCIQKKVFVNAIFMYIEAVSNDERL